MGNSESKPSIDGPGSDFVRSAVADNCVVIFSKTYCSYCRASKQTFKNLGVEPKVIELDKRQDGDTLQEILSQMTGGKTVPRVFVNGTCIGGNSETSSLFKSGRLQEMLDKCGT